MTQTPPHEGRRVPRALKLDRLLQYQDLLENKRYQGETAYSSFSAPQKSRTEIKIYSANSKLLQPDRVIGRCGASYNKTRFFIIGEIVFLFLPIYCGGFFL